MVFSVKKVDDDIEEENDLQNGLKNYADQIRQHWGMFVDRNMQVIEDVDKFRYDVKDNRRLN